MLDASNVNEVMAQLPPLGDLQAGFQASSYATRGVDEASSSSNKDENGSLKIQGSIRVNLRCPGELAEPVYDADTNGSIAVTIAVENSKIRRAIGGRATGCVLRNEILGRTVRAPQVRRADATSATKVAHIIQIRHRDEVESPVTDWLEEAYRFSEQPQASKARRSTAKKKTPAAKARKATARPSKKR